MATSYSREQIVDLAMQMLGGGASLDDAIKAAADYGVDLASVYYSDPGTSFSASTPADTGSVDTGRVDTGRVDTGPIYSEPDYSGFEDVIVDPRSGSSGSVPVQSPLSTVSSGSVDTGPVVTSEVLPTGSNVGANATVTSPLASVGPSGTPALDINTEVKDVKDFFKVMTGAAPTMSDAEIASYIKNNPETYNLDLLWLTEKQNPTLTPVGGATIDTGSVDTGRVDTGPVDTGRVDTGRVDTGPVDTGPVVTAGALPTVSSTDTSATVTSPLESMASGSALGASSTSSQGGTSPLDTAGSTGTTPLDTVSPTVTDKFYDPKLKANWGVESVGDFGLQNDPRFHGQGSQFYIDPVTGKYLTEQEYLSTANTPEALKYQADQAEKERLQGIYTSVGNQVRSFIDPNSSGGSWTKESGLDSGPGFGVQGMLDQLGQRIVEKTGVTDLNNLQLKYVDKPVTETIYAFAGDDGTQYRRLVPDPATGESTYQALTPDEISRLRTERDVDGNTTTLLDSTVKQGQVYDKSTGKLVSDSESINLGDWGQGPGITYGSINFDENGKPIVSTSGEDTTAGIVKAAAQLGPVVTIANVLSGGALTPLQLAVNAVSAVDAANRGNILPLIATAAGAGGYTGIIDPSLASNIQTGVSAIGALDKGNVLGALATVAGSGLGSEVGSIDLGGGLKVTDALNAVSAVDSLVKGDIAGALTLAGKAAGSDELQTAGTALKVKNAIESGNLNAAVSAGAQLYNNVNQLVDKSQVASLLANSAGIGAIDADLGADLGGLKASTVAGALGNDTVTGALGQLNQAATSLVKDYVSAGGSMEPTDLSAALSKLTDPYGRPLPATEVDRLVTAAQGQLDTQTRNQKIQTDTLSVLADYTGRDSDLSRESAYERLVAAGNSGDRANEILASVDAQVEANRAARATTQAQNQAAIAAGAGEFSGADERAAIAAGAGEFTGTDKAAAINTRISNATSFNDAYAIARKEFGPNATFNYQGKLYSTATAEERPDLTGKVSSTSQVTDTPYVAPNGMHNRAAFIQAGGGTSDADYAKYVQAVNALVSEGKSGTLIKPSSVNSTGKELPSTTGPVTMEKPKVDSVLGSVAAQGVASFGANSIAGVLSSLGFTDAGKTVLDKANAIAAAATEAEGPEITVGKQYIDEAIQKVGQSSGIKDFAANVGNLVSTAFKNPKAFGATVGSEVVEELLQLATIKFPGSFLVKETVASALENGGAAYNTEYESQMAKGASKEDAHEAAQKAAGTAAGISIALGGAAAGLGKVAGKVIGSQADEVPTSAVGQVGKTTLKESAQEVVEEGSIAAGIDLALGRPIDAVNVLTNMTGGALYGGPTSGVMQATKLDTLDQTPSTSIGSGISSQLTNDLNSGVDLTASIKSVVGNNISADLGGTIDSTIKAVIDNGVDLSKGVTDLTSSAVSNTGDTTIVINNVVSSLASNGADLNANAGSIVTGAISGGSSVGDAVDTTIKAITANGGSLADSASSIISSVGASGNATQLVEATGSVVGAAIAGGSNVTTITSNAVDAALAASGGSTDVVSKVVGGIASQGNNDATAAAVSSAVTSSGDTTLAVGAALSNGGNASTVLSTASNAAISSGADAGSVVSDTITAALGNQVGGKVAVDSAVKGALDAGADTTVVVGSAIKSGLDAGMSTGTVVSSTVGSALSTGADSTVVIDGTLSAVAQAGGNVSQAAGSAVKASLGAGADANETIIAATSSAIKNGADVGSAVTTVIAGAVQGGTSLSDASASSVATAIVGGANADTVIKAVTDSNSGLSVQSQSNNGVTQVVASDGNITTDVVMDGNSQSVTITSTDTKTGSGTQTVIQSDGTTKSDVGLQGQIDVLQQSVADINTSLSTAINDAIKSGQTGDAALQTAIDKVASDLGTSKTDLLTQIGKTETELKSDFTTQLSGIETKLTTAINDAIKSGQTGDVALQSAIDKVASDLGLTKEQVLDQVGKTETALKGEVKTLSDTVTKINTDLSTEIKNVLKTTQDADTVLNTSISKVASDLGLTKDQLLEQIGKTESQLKSEIQTTQDTITQVKSDLTTAIENAAKTSSDADKIITGAVDKVASDLGLTKKELLDQIGETESSLKTELSKELAKVTEQLGKEIQNARRASSAGSSLLPGMFAGMELERLRGQMLKSGPAGQQLDPLAAMKQRIEDMNAIDPALAAVMSQRLGLPQPQLPSYTYGQETSIDDILGLKTKEEPEEEAVYAQGGFVEPLRARAINPQFMNRGGVLPGGREDFKSGKHVAGDGDGQSDDIPAWLADGEFVFPADVVSALGNGSTKAGTDKLYKMMHEIRARARSTKVKDLPPPAHKSPLDYIKKGK